MKSLLFLLLPFTLLSQNFKTIGYLPYYRFSWINDIEFQRLSHVNIAFANPVDSTGTLSCGGVSINNAVQKAKLGGCKVFISIGGGYLTPEQEAAWDYLALPANRAAYIQKIVNYVQANNLDGVDVDLEWQYVKSWYSPFILDLKAALTPLGYPLTAALPGSYRYPLVSNAALNAFDWVNMMVYDLTGPFAPNNPGQHSPYDWAEDCIAYWLNQNVPASKLTLGVPFYGYDFGQSPVASYSYRYLVGLDTANAWKDQLDMTYYNGIPTIKAKTTLAKNAVSGIMIWEIGQDAFGSAKQFSLLKAIDESVHPTSNLEIISQSDAHILIYPNPASSQITISGLSSNGLLPDRLNVFNAFGDLALSLEKPADNQEIKLDNLPNGLYWLRLEKNGALLSQAKFLILN